MDKTAIEKIIKQVLAELGKTSDAIPVELSARHVHLSRADMDTLFGFGENPTPAKELSQPGQFLSKERVRLIGPRGVIDNVAVLGPARPESQVEISLTDARILGIDTPVRQSGEIEDTPGIVLSSHKGIVGLDQGVIVAGRHIHMPAKDAARFNVRDGDRIKVRMNSSRPVVMEDVLVRVSDRFNLAMHIDFDEGNACGWKQGVPGTIVTNQEKVVEF
ncbi:MAG: phosphate propanoyltransferase [Desulfobacteraceae bacterium]|nr:phosphate propanoyltransferase [Desulfobacteraceae bacterium]